MYDPYDYYFKKAKKSWFKARSIFKLEEIDKKFKIFDKSVCNVMDIWCSPWSWIQYAHNILINYPNKNFKIIGFDLKPTHLDLINTYLYEQDITEIDKVYDILLENWIEKFDFIMSDMAPNTTWIKDLDAMKSIWLIETTLPIYKKFLKEDWKFVIKVFMWPWFDEFVKELKEIYWWKSIKIYKPASTRKNSKEVFVIKI